MRSARREDHDPSALSQPAGARTRRHLRPVPTADQRLTLGDVDRGRWQLWSVTFILLIALSLAIVVVSYWREELPDVIAGALDFGALRFVFLALSVAFALYVVDRERRFRRVTYALIDSRAHSLALQERLRELSALQQVATALNSSLEIEKVLEVFLRQACRIVDASEGAALLRDPERGSFVVASAIPESLTGEFVIGEDLPGTVARTRLATLVPGPAEIEHYPWLVSRGASSSMCAPLIANGELTGILILNGTGERRFGEYDLRILMLFAEQAAVAISNAQAFKRERESVSRLADLDRLKTEFIATITHELKTPLTSLMGYATILRKRATELPPEQREEFFDIMARQGDRILRLIEELLQSSRIDAGAARLRREPLDLRAIVKDVEAGLSSLTKSHTLAIEAPDRDLGLFGDATALEHVLTNLLENALKYSQPGTTIRLGVEERDAEVLISVADEGQGIPAEDLPHIFERFRQAESSGRTRNSVGLGLYIVRSLVNAHGGRVWADSQVGVGTTFTIALPRRSFEGPLQNAEESRGLLDQVTEVP